MQAGNDNERQFGRPTYMNIDLSHCDKFGHTVLPIEQTKISLKER